MKTEIHAAALAFVQDHHCAATSPLELIEDAMKMGSVIGQIHLAKRETKRLARLRAGLAVNDGGEMSGTLDA